MVIMCGCDDGDSGDKKKRALREKALRKKVN
jgi:hypothetical protein